MATGCYVRSAPGSVAVSATPTRLARLGGDEFCVLLPNVGGLGAALEVAERIMAILEQPFDIDGMTLAVDASCGIAIAPADGDSADLLLQRSDVAMYVAKGSHANVVAYHDTSTSTLPPDCHCSASCVPPSPNANSSLHYQPKAVLVTGHIQGVEALIRWQHPTLGLGAPRPVHPPCRAHRPDQAPDHMGAQHRAAPTPPVANPDRPARPPI